MFSSRQRGDGLQARVSALNLRRSDRERTPDAVPPSALTPVDPVEIDDEEDELRDGTAAAEPAADEQAPAEETAAPSPLDIAPVRLAPSLNATTGATSRASIEAAIPRIYPFIMERIDTEVAA